jgi:Ran GTPase-activating protein (RanGAP) involved in mRNA processing and transport
MVRSVNIEISGSSSCESLPIITHDEEENHDVILVTAILPTVVNSDSAISASARLLDLVDGLNTAAVERVKISNISFVDGDVEGLCAFLVMHAPSVRHLSLANISDYIASSRSDKSETKAIMALTLAFQTASLETIDLSRNNLSYELWSILNSHHSCVKKVVMDGVVIDDQSMAMLARSSRFVAAVENFHLVMHQPLGTSGVEASNQLLQQFTRLRTLRWANRSSEDSLPSPPEAHLPWSGISRMAERNRSTLETLVLEGSQTTESDVILICATIGLLPRLSVLKLRRLGIADHALGMIVSVLIQKLPPLTCFDLSYNCIQSGGSFALMEILSNTKISQSLKSLILKNNQLDRPSLSKLLKTAACRASTEFELRCDNNGADTGLLAYEFALTNTTAEADRDKMIRELARVKSQLKEAQYHLREISAAQTTILADYQKLNRENQAIKAERETLVQAFEILGCAKQVQAQARLLSRVSQIEDCLFGETHRRSGSAGSVTETLSITGDETSRSRSTSYDEASIAIKGGRRRPLSRSRSNESMVPLSGDRRQRELKGSVDAAHHGSVTTAATLGSSRSTLFSASVDSFEDLTGSTTTFAFTPSPRRRLPVRVMSERWARPGSMSISLPAERVPKSPSLHSSQHSFRFGDSTRSLKCDIAEEDEDEASLDPNEVVERDRVHIASQHQVQS